MGEFTGVLDAINAGDSEAIGRAIALVYPDLRDIAHHRLRRVPAERILDTTSLVHECYLRMTRIGKLRIEDRSHFLAYAARAMRSIVVDFARERLTQRMGEGSEPVTLSTELTDGDDAGARQLLEIEDALQKLAQVEPRLVQVVEMRYFAGYSVEEIARSLSVTERTVRRDWEKARLLLSEALQP